MLNFRHLSSPKGKHCLHEKENKCKTLPNTLPAVCFWSSSGCHEQSHTKASLNTSLMEKHFYEKEKYPKLYIYPSIDV